MTGLKHSTLFATAILLLYPTGLRADRPSAHPCELLTEGLVREYLSVPVEIKIDQDDSSLSRFPNCGYRWRIMSEADEKAASDANTARMMENIKAGKSPDDGVNLNLRTHAQVRLTVAEFDNAEKALSGLEGAKSFMIGRDEQRGREPTPWEPVEGVGSKAYYHGSQLSFVWGDIMIHLDVSPQERAVAIAQAIME